MDATGMTMWNNAGSGSGWVELWSLCQSTGPMGARYVYAMLFLFSNAFAWVVRGNPRISFLGQSQSEAVMLISFTCFLFHFVMFISTVYTRNVHDRRNSWHSKWWPAKIIILVVYFFMIPSMAPLGLTRLYGTVSHFGAGVFIFIQHISVIRYITRLNSRWCGPNFDNHYRKVITISILSYIWSTAGIVFMSFRYLGCHVNVVLISTTLFLVCLIFIIPMLSMENGFYMEPGLLGVYIVFLCWSAIKSEPETGCYKKENFCSDANWITIISFVIALISITVTTFSTGTDYKCIQFGNVVESENDVPYGYGFFHFVFATGSMYFGMVLVGWDTSHASERWSIDVGWTSTWVHVANEGVAVICFVAVIIARRYGIGWLTHILGKIFGIGGQQHGNESHHTESEESEMENRPAPPPTSPRSSTVSHYTESSDSDETENEPPPPPPPSPRSFRGIEREGSETDGDGPPSDSSRAIDAGHLQNRPMPRRRNPMGGHLCRRRRGRRQSSPVY